MKTVLGWLWFLAIQGIALALFPVGVVLVALLAAAQAWKHTRSWYNGAFIESWYGGRLTWLFGNDEDGVLGPAAYNPYASRWRTFVWSALRNPTNNLRFLVAWKGGPWFQKRWNGLYVQAGFRPDTGWPVLSAGRGTGTVIVRENAPVIP